MKSIWLVKHQKWGYCTLFQNKMLCGLWYENKNPSMQKNYGKIVSGSKFEPHIKIMKITKNTAFRAAKLINNVKSCEINMRSI